MRINNILELLKWNKIGKRERGCFCVTGSPRYDDSVEVGGYYCVNTCTYTIIETDNNYLCNRSRK